MDQAALIALVDQLRSQGREASTVEFKSNWDLPRDIGEYLSALANSAVLERHDHAYLVWGVNDQTHEVTSTTFKPFSAKGEGTHPLIMWLTQSTSPKPDFEFYEVQLQPGGALRSSAHFEGTREFLTVQKGQVTVESAADAEELGPGDSATYRADVPHAIINLGKGEALVFLVDIYR